MNDRIRFVIILLGIYSLGYAQLQLGIKGGANYSTMDYIDTRNIDFTKTEWIVGANGGISAEYGINDYLSLRAELLFSQKGFSVRKYLNSQLFNISDTRYSDTWELTKNYIELPILLNYYYEGERFKIYFGLGPYLSYWAGGTMSMSLYTQDLGGPNVFQKNVSESYVFTSEYDSDKKKDNRFDLGASVGIGFGYKVKRGIFFIDVRYNHGLLNNKIWQTEMPNRAFNELNRNLAASFGFMLTLKEKPVKQPQEDENFDESQLDN